MIEQRDRISTRFTYNRAFSKAFTGYQPNSTAVQMRSIDIWCVKDGKLIEHLGRTGTNSICWKYSSESARRQLESWKDNEPLDVAGVSS